MKKILKNILISTAIIYFVITAIIIGALTYNTYYFVYGTFAGEYENIRDVSQEVQDSTNARIKELTENKNLKSDYPFLGVIEIQNNTSYIINIIDMFTYALIISVIIGVVLGIMTAINEKTKNKIVLLFVGGITIIDTIIALFRNSKNFVEEWFYAFQQTIILYTVVFAIAFFIIRFYTKHKEKKMNK